MIENLSKYKTLIVVLIVLVICGFFLMDANNMQKSRGGIPVLKIADRTYTDGDLLKLGSSGYELSMALFQSGDFQVYGFLTMLAGNDQENATENFFINRMLLRSAQEEFGIYPSEEEIDSTIRKFRAFTSPDGAFSQEKYRLFIERGLGRLGLIEADIRELASDMLVHRKLTEILGTGLTTNPNIVAKQIAIDGQRINSKLARIDIAPIKAKIAPTDEEIKTYWETVQDAFKTDEKRKFTYFIAKTTLPAEPAPIPALAADADEAAKTEHAKKVAERDAAIAEGKRLARLEVGRKVDDFLYQLESQNDLDFKKRAEESGFKLQTTELIAQSAAPAELKAELRGSSTQGTAADALFRLNVTSDPASKIIDLAVGENDWLVAHVDEVEASRVKTFDEAKDIAREQLSTNQATAALTKAATEANEKIKAALAEGKSFEDAVKAAGITSEILTLTETTQSSQLDTSKYPAGLFDSAKYTAPGSLTEPVIDVNSAFIILVEKREFVKDANATEAITMQVNRETEGNRINAFMTWLDDKADASDIKRLNRQ
ncbi:MAG: SurA N-terminal domain-containing protein [Verrucomicrobiota bacterium]